jgi:hypothetical protein
MLYFDFGEEASYDCLFDLTQTVSQQVQANRYTAAKFFHTNLQNFCVNSQMFTHFHEIFFLPVWTTNNAQKSLSWTFSQKIFCILPKTIHFTSSHRKHKKIFVKKSMKGYFERCLSPIPVKKDFVKMCENL